MFGLPVGELQTQFEGNELDIMFGFSPKIYLRLKFSLKTQFESNNY